MRLWLCLLAKHFSVDFFFWRNISMVNSNFYHVAATHFDVAIILLDVIMLYMHVNIGCACYQQWFCLWSLDKMMSCTMSFNTLLYHYTTLHNFSNLTIVCKNVSGIRPSLRIMRCKCDQSKSLYVYAVDVGWCRWVTMYLPLASLKL